MTSKKKIWMQGIGASIVTIGILGAWVFTPQFNKVSQVQPVSAYVEEVDIAPDNIERSPRSRAREEHGEETGPFAMAPPQARMDRAAAIKRAEDLAAVRDNPQEPIEVRENADRLLGEHLEVYFPAAGGGVERAEPKNGDEDIPSWSELARKGILDGMPYMFALVNLLIAEVTRRRLKGASA